MYTCDPQGLKGASERSYEKLARIFGDLVQERKLAQMADGLHILGDSVTDLASNYAEVLARSEECGLTFKPSKAVVCPRTINLFGWVLKDHVWYPTGHTTSALVNAPEPLTVKQMCSFLGSFKQLSSSLPGYAKVIHCLEQLVGGRASAEKIVWTDTLRSAFTEAKQLASHPKGIAEPRPEDQLYTYSDYSAESRAVGGRLVIHRKQTDGSITELIGGFFSVIVDKHKQSWLPCEGEALGIRLVLDHFQNQIRESENPVIHYTDSQPCVLAWKRSKRGAFSSSSRIAAFLTGLSVLPVDLRYKPGRDMYTSDYASRHPEPCKADRCQICQFANDLQQVGDNALRIRSVTIEDIRSGKSVMPLTQNKIWRDIQAKDPTHSRLKDLIATRQLPETRKRKGEHTKLKLLHNLYTQGRLYVEKGLVMIRTPESETIGGDVISVPTSMFPGVVNALHIRLDHPSKAQLTALIARYFYTPGWRGIINEVIDSCHQCASMKQLPKVLLQDTSSSPDNIGSHFAADVIEREGQRILAIRECISQYTRAQLIHDQTAETLKRAVISLVIDIMPDTGTEIRVDGATSFQALQTQSLTEDSLLNTMGIRFVVGRLMNKNKNPVGENMVKEIQKEILRFKGAPGPITETDLALIIKNINTRIRYNSLTPKEILYRRDNLTNSPISIEDQKVIQQQALHRKESSKSSMKHKGKFRKATPPQTFNVGDLVMMQNHVSKTSPRCTYIIDKIPEDSTQFILIRKLSDKLRPRLYEVCPDELVLVPNANINAAPKQKRNAAVSARNKIKATVYSVKPTYRKTKPGWLEEDQIDDWDVVSPFLLPEPAVDETSSSSNTSVTNSSHEDIAPNNSDSVSSEEDNYIWDMSPSQYSLHGANSVLPHKDQPPPLMSLHVDLPLHIPSGSSTPASRERIHGMSSNPLQRRNAFRSPRVNEAFSRSPSPSSMVSSNVILAPRKSRLPLPTSPSQVNLHEVNDLSSLPDTYHAPLRRSTRQVSRTYYSTARPHPLPGALREPSRSRTSTQSTREGQEEREEQIRSITQALAATDCNRLSARTRSNKQARGK